MADRQATMYSGTSFTMATAGLRIADILFRYGSDEFAALLNDTSSETAALIGERIRTAVRSASFTHRDVGSLALDVATTAVSCPTDGESLTELIAKAHPNRKPSALTQGV